MKRRVALLVALTAVAAACGTTSGPESGFQVGESQLVAAPAEVVGHPDPDLRVVKVAWVDQDVTDAVLRRDVPDGVSPADPADRIDNVTDLPEADLALSVQTPGSQPDLTPIPSAGLNWGSAEVEGDWVFTNPTKIGSPLVFLVTEDHGDWLKVMAPVRPNGQEGWIETDQVEIKTHEWRVEVDVSSNGLRVWNGDELVVDTGTVDGKTTSPTPLGRFYINEKQQQYPTSPYGSWIISTNGFSDSLERFGGEVPIFAIHGTAYEGSIGSDISNGCVRIPNEMVETIADVVPVGTPVDVFA